MPPAADLAWLCERCDCLLGSGVPDDPGERSLEIGAALERELFEACQEMGATRTGIDEPRGFAPAWEFSDSYTARDRELDDCRYGLALE